MPFILRPHWFIVVFLGVCACASFVGYAMAKANPLLGVITDRVMSEVDANQDRKVDRAEFAAAREVHFSSADKNGDSFVTRDEFASEMTRVTGELGLVWADQFFAAMDRDKDNLLARDELETLGESVFAELDKDDDGFVTPSDVHPSLAMAD